MVMNVKQPFSFCKVLDLSNENGMFCGKVFADLGASVIKVERPGGDPARDNSPFYHNTQNRDKSLFWFANNTGKRSITLDIETHDGKEIFKKLVESCDLIIETFPVGYMTQLGLDYSNLRSINPEIILVSITPFGQTGSHIFNKTCDLVALALGGLMSSTGDPDRAPVKPSVELSYPLVGIQAAIGAMIALYNRHNTGKGEHIDVSIKECMAPTAWITPNLWFLNRLIFNREGEKAHRVQIVVRQIWQCKDGYLSWRLFTGTDADKTQALVNWMDEEGIGKELKEIDWRKVDMNEVKQDQIDNWEKYWKAFFLSKKKAELYKEGVKRGIMIFPVNNFRDLCENEQLLFRNFWTKVAHSELEDDIPYPGPPFKSEEDWWVVKRPPLIGEHNEVIYKKLGNSQKQIELLKARHVI